MQSYLLAIDQGTTSSRAIVFSRQGELMSQHQIDLKQSFPQLGWVEQDPLEMWQSTLACCQQALQKLNLSAREVAAIGMSNQRETTIIWDRQTGRAVYPAIVWQDRRTSAMCAELAKHPMSAKIAEKTGLLLDPYFSATKILWVLQQVPTVRERAERGELAFGTVDTFLLWHLTKGAVHATDATNASRTLLFNIHTQQWDDELLAMFNIPKTLLPDVRDSSADYGKTAPEYFGESIAIAGIAGDQQAATVGQACFQSGMVKSTYGTGCFMLLNTGSHVVHSKNRLLSTVAYRLENKVTYGLEGSIFCAGATIKWLRDTLKLIRNADETEEIAKSIPDNGGVYLVPAFTGLGAPYWDPDARGALLGLTRDSGVSHIVRAALESVCYETRDLLMAMHADGVEHITQLRVDGGMAKNNWLLQYLADVLNVTVQRPACIETSALGAAYLAGLQVGVYQSLDEIMALWQCNATFAPLNHAASKHLYQGWSAAVARVLANNHPLKLE